MEIITRRAREIFACPPFPRPNRLSFNRKNDMLPPGLAIIRNYGFITVVMAFVRGDCGGDIGRRVGGNAQRCPRLDAAA